MIELLINTLTNTVIVMAIFATAWSSNFILSLYNNIKLLGEEFDWKRIRDGFLKMASVVCGTALLAISITFVPIFAQYVGVPIADNYVEFLNILTIIGIFLKSTYSYIKQAQETLNGIIEYKK